MFVILLSLVFFSISNGYIVNVYRAPDVQATPFASEDFQLEPRLFANIFNKTTFNNTLIANKTRAIRTVIRNWLLNSLESSDGTRAFEDDFGEAILPLDESDVLVLQPQLQPLLISSVQMQMPQVQVMQQLPVMQQIPLMQQYPMVQPLVHQIPLIQQVPRVQKVPMVSQMQLMPQRIQIPVYEEELSDY